MVLEPQRLRFVLTILALYKLYVCMYVEISVGLGFPWEWKSHGEWE